MMKHQTRFKRSLVATIGVLGLMVGLVSIPLAIGEAREGCTDASLRGEYGFKGAGSVVLPNGTHADLAVTGRAVFDGQGGKTGTQTTSFDGTITRQTTTGTYEVRSDCTGSETFKLSPSGMIVHADFVIVDKGREAFFIETDPGTVLSVTSERQ